jgi:dipeptidyl aminopeptidase/acylaminoacyl peptidase
MAPVDFERFRARDGLEIPVWVTRPVGTDGRPLPGPLPTVVLVHGGPWVRGSHWAWHAEAQFLASRGYLVVEPEFRGSEGYGRALFRAGLRQWGRAMQDDLVDALAWAAQRGWADAGRACIAGASYGGYATLMGLIRHPETWRCGVAWVAVTDPRLLFRWSYVSDVNDEARGYTYPQLIGDPEADRAMLEEVTPVLHAARLRSPLMLAFGGRDARVPIEHGRRLHQALRAAGRTPAEYVVYEDEGHGWFLLENQLDFARRLERFLAEQLAPR